MYIAHINPEIIILCHTSVLTSLSAFLPRALDMDDVIPPPIAPPDCIIINVCKGNTIAKLANATVPILPTKKASAIVENVIKNTAAIFGVASFHNRLMTDPSKSSLI